jgi:hypothetical protein
MVKNAFALLDLLGILQDNASKNILLQLADLMNNMIIYTKFVCASKITTESMVNAKFQLHVEVIHYGMVSDVNATLDIF